ncbi:AzlC family ABC transporter permease [Aliihoeflea sp. 40Bstr573]|uniref:AzlC family ABC transporter permease n=1 Tax=Aliihoeflea sp. 40Bstr573 TaxID=2696467 RepID=UPI0020966110|nr:AzlC family ABC transporter permease [Aliihoeflea sp. 40Bstr573]MCO6385789.1 branched-chain amino acid ABC transporter permease [Aliihoeflea sp. 40Bstr573]
MSTPAESHIDAPDPDFSTRLKWFARGCRASMSVPALILASSFVGFAALALEAGFTLAQTVFMTGIVWALPAKVVLIGAVLAGNGIAGAAFAVALSSVRLAPMVVVLVPELRGPRTRPWVLYLLSHFVAVTSWVIALEQVRHVPRAFRTTWYGGVGSSLVVLNMIVVALVYMLAQNLPPMISAALFMLTPIYFLTSLWVSARERAGHVAMVLGLVLGPLFYVLVPDFSLLATGLVGGLLAYLFHVVMKRRKTT